MKPTIIYLPTRRNRTCSSRNRYSTRKNSIRDRARNGQSAHFQKEKKRHECIGMGDSGMTNLSERVDELLWQDRTIAVTLPS